ncbi:MAG: rod shape-determining protein MreC, partial [Gemmatimonadetes bacterium]|nr:rod shape-determining protein MreC [Gemmatimonadota bacterium]
TAHGVSVNDPVVVADGLIGLIREVFDRSAVVMDWTHPEFGVSVMTEDGEAFGFVEPVQGAFREEDRMILNGVPFYTPIEEGTLLVTSGRGSVYPRGIPVGRVGSLAEAEAGWRKSFWVEPAARPGTATHVLVLISASPGVGESIEPLWFPEPMLPDSGSAPARPGPSPNPSAPGSGYGPAATPPAGPPAGLP